MASALLGPGPGPVTVALSLRAGVAHDLARDDAGRLHDAIIGALTQEVGVHVSSVIRPPTLQTERGGSASRLELFFDLAYVLVVLELAGTFYTDLTVHGVLVLAGLFAAIWFSWVGFTLYANRFDTDDLLYRVSKLTATLTIAGCAASASDATGAYAVPFAASYLLGRLVLLGLYLRAWRHVTEARPTIRVYLISVGVSAALWAVSLGLDGPARYWLWAAAVLVDAVGPVLATLRRDTLPLHVEHLPERFGLLIILVLGEALGGAVRGIHDAHWAGPSLGVGLVGMVVAAAMWWIYFDTAATRSSSSLERADEEPDREAGTDERHDLFIYGHLPLAFGAVTVGVSLEDFTAHRDLTDGWILAVGMGCFLVGVALIVAGTARSWRSVWPWPSAFVPLVVVLPLLPLPSSVSLVAAMAFVLLVLSVHGTRANRRSAGAR